MNNLTLHKLGILGQIQITANDHETDQTLMVLLYIYASCTYLCLC